MSKRNIGYLEIILGFSILSIDLMLVRVIQAIDKASGSWHSQIHSYFHEPIIFFPFAIVGCLILIGIFTVLYNLQEK